MSDAQKDKPKSEEHKRHLSESAKGRVGSNLGKHWSEESKKKLSETKKKDIKNTERLCRLIKPSKKQIKLFEIIKTKYPDNEVIMEYPIKTGNHRFSIDIAIPNLKTGFEWDEPYWHRDKEKDQRRHELIEAEGWKLTHYSQTSEFC